MWQNEEEKCRLPRVAVQCPVGGCDFASDESLINKTELAPRQAGTAWRCARDSKSGLGLVLNLGLDDDDDQNMYCD